ncbi:DUF397 domain-containing protein [Kitasatospora sp. NPDC058162]|uniref:DUF397 domain-containing protein n=1 Tax=Kitasatospora sp. NPDC058162 TaxID=3346362 RepID=UPI0036DF825B
MSVDLTWRKSSYSGGEGGNCVEVASTLPIDWRKSSASNPNDDCVEFGQLASIVAVRDSKDPHGPALTFSPDSWQSFIADIRSDNFPTTP